MNKRNTYFPLSILCLVASLAVCLTSCSSTPGCRVDGTVRDKAYDGKTVYLCETYGQTVVDSTLVSHSSFRFNLDGLAQDVYLLKLKVTPDDLFPITLPVVAEKGRIRVALGEIVYTSGTPLNDVTQDFLLAVDRYSDNMPSAVCLFSGNSIQRTSDCSSFPKCYTDQWFPYPEVHSFPLR